MADRLRAFWLSDCLGSYRFRCYEVWFGFLEGFRVEGLGSRI